MRIGFHRVDISAFEPGMTMMGWGQPTQQARGVEVPLYSRAMVVEDEAGHRAAYVVVELMAVTQGVWLEVTERLQRDHPALGLGPDQVALVATHTHSGPSGFSHHFWLNLSTPGFSGRVYDRIVQGVVDSIVGAARALQPASLTVQAGEVPREAGVAFNRSWFAYSRNQGVEPVPFERRDEAVDREFTLLTARSTTGEVLGLASWFGLHGTCIHKEQQELHPDHKGLAALALEADGAGVALMAQACCGDVSPNHRHDPARGHTVGPTDDDHANAGLAAEAQVEVVRELWRAPTRALDGSVAVVSSVVDFDRAMVDPAFSPDGAAHVTSPARLGLSMAEGTAEGPGPLYPLRALNRAASRGKALADRVRGLGRPARHDPKIPMLELSRGDRSRFGGVWPVRWLPRVDPIVGWIRDHVRRGTAGPEPWLPTRLTLQLMRIGPLVLCMVPFEVTTVAGRRIRATLAERLPDDVERIVVSSYANAYCGYLTTYEEYQLQHYEAGYNVFGPFALGAVRTAVAELAERLAQRPQGVDRTGELPAPRPREALERTAFVAPWDAI